MLVTEGRAKWATGVPPVTGCSRTTQETSAVDPAAASPMKTRSTAGGTADFRSSTAMAMPHPAVASNRERVVMLRIREIDMRHAFLLQLILNFSIYK